MFEKLRAVLGKRKGIQWLNRNGEPAVGQSQSYSLSDIMSCYREGSYDNNFANITRIAEAFAEVSPFAVDERGEPLKAQPRLIEILNSPNEQMSGSDFWETLIVLMLVHPTVYILCWHEERGRLVPGGPITPNNIAGFTFMEGVGISRLENEVQYFYNGNTYTPDDVIELSLNVNPYSLLSGYSPSMAAKKWATVDDYAADYQAGWFRNGGVPAGQFIITAPSKDEFNRIVDGLQAHHRGPNNANNVVYSHRPTSSIDGKPLPSSIEWVPFAQTSEKGTLQSIFDQAEKKLDTNFGVPAEIKGFLQNSNYASAEVADYIFSRWVIYPKLRKVYSKLTHQLNRIAGNLGFALGFDYELPVLTDTRKVQAESLQILINAGYTTESAVKALQLPKSFLELTEKPVKNVVETETNEEKPSQEQKSLKKKDVDLDTDEIWRQPANEVLLHAMQNYMERVLDKGVTLVHDILSKKGDGAVLTEDERREIIDELRTWLQDSGLPQQTIDTVIAELNQIIQNSGETSMEEFANSLGFLSTQFEMNEEQRAEFTERITELIQKFGQESIERVDGLLGTGIQESWDDSKIQTELELIKENDQYRAERWAKSEQHYADETAVIVAAILASQRAETNLVPYKTWHINPISPDVCIDCYHMDGETVPVDQPFSNGQMVPHEHPFCYCTMDITFRPPQKSVKITCPHCKRYMMESTGGVMKNVICANSKCKRHYDIEVNNGKIKAIERKTND